MRSQAEPLFVGRPREKEGNAGSGSIDEGHSYR